MKISINNKEIELSPTQEATIKEALGMKEKKGLWKPKDGENYKFIGIAGVVFSEPWAGGDGICKTRLEIGNVFPTEEAAEKHLEKLKAIQRIKVYIAENCEDFTPDWSDGQKKKWYIYCREKNILTCDATYSRNYGSIIPLLVSWEDAQKVIDNCADDLKIVFDVKS